MEWVAIKLIFGRVANALKPVGAVLAEVPWFAWVIGALIIALPVNGCVQYDNGFDAGVKAEKADRRAKEKAAQEAQAASAGKASQERQADQNTITEAQKGRSDAIQGQDDTKPSAASNALNCERMRRAGASVQHLPACN